MSANEIPGNKRAGNFAGSDTFFCWPLWSLLTTVFAFLFVLPYIGILAILIFPILLFACLASVAGLYRAMTRSKWRRATSMGAYLFFILSIVFMPSLIARPLGRTADTIHLLSQKSEFESKLRVNPVGQKPVWAFDWSAWVTSNTLVIYDESGRVSLPGGDPAWNDSDMELFRIFAGHVGPIMGHYYRCDI